MRKNQVQWWAQEGLNIEDIIKHANREAEDFPERTVEIHFHKPFDEGGLPQRPTAVEVGQAHASGVVEEPPPAGVLGEPVAARARAGPQRRALRGTPSWWTDAATGSPA